MTTVSFLAKLLAPLMRNYFPNVCRVHRFILCLNYKMFPLVLYHPLLGQCIALFAVAEEWLLLDIGWFVLFSSPRKDTTLAYLMSSEVSITLLFYSPWFSKAYRLQVWYQGPKIDRFGSHCNWSSFRMSFNIRERETSYCWIESPHRP